MKLKKFCRIVFFCSLSIGLFGSGICFSVAALVQRPEHPRLDAFRTNWLSLIGIIYY